MTNPIQAIQAEIPVRSSEGLICPITQESMEDPYILLEDGFTYEEWAIERWLTQNPNRSPMVGKLSSATLCPNYMAKKRDFECPITKEAFKEPYYCVEDGQTYEKRAILHWIETETSDPGAGVLYLPKVKSPVTGEAFSTFTFYANKLFFDEGIPVNQEPFVVDVMDVIHGPIPEERVAIFDSMLRDLIAQLPNEELKETIAQRRIELGLEVYDSFYDLPDLSNLDLSKMKLVGLEQKSCLTRDTDFSNTVFEDCNFARGRLVNCNMSNTTFTGCSFIGEETCFHKTDMRNAVIYYESCSIEQGDTWELAQAPEQFREELINRGALNVDTVSFRSGVDRVLANITTNRYRDCNLIKMCNLI